MGIIAELWDAMNLGCSGCKRWDLIEDERVLKAYEHKDRQSASEGTQEALRELTVFSEELGLYEFSNKGPSEVREGPSDLKR